MALKHILILVYAVSVVCGENEQTNATHVNELFDSFRGAREGVSYFGLVSCAMKYDVNCFLDAAEDFVDNRRTELLAEADSFQSSSRSDPENRPSHLAGTLNRLVSELSNMFTNGLSGFFETGREADDDNDLTDDDLNDTTTSSLNGVTRESRKLARGHKKHKHEGLIIKIVRIVKYAIYALVFFLKIVAILLMFHVFVNFKLLLVAMWGVALLAVKVWLSHKDGGEHVIIQEDVHHDHHYEDDHHDHHFEHLPVEDWHRSYVPKENYAQKIAYRGQKPTSSWSSWLD